MALKTFKPITPSLRQLVMLTGRSSIRASRSSSSPRASPRRAAATTTAASPSASVAAAISRAIGSSISSAASLISRRRSSRIEYDPNRTSFIALIRYTDGEQAYIIAPQRLSVGDEVISGQQVDVKPGNAMPLASMPVGTIVHNVEIKIGKGAAMVRSAGNFAQVVGRDQGYVIVRLNSGEQRLVHGQCFATVGAVSNPDHMNASVGKAGRSRWLGRRPHNRGVTMNPVDHPHGGGEGRTRAAGIRSRPGASRPRARRLVRTNPLTNSS